MQTDRQNSYINIARHAALLSQRGCAILRLCQQLASIVQYIERNLLSLVTSASDLPLFTSKFCSLLFVVVVHAGCDKQDSLIRDGVCGKLHDPSSQLLFAPQQHGRRKQMWIGMARSSPPSLPPLPSPPLSSPPLPSPRLPFPPLPSP